MSAREKYTDDQIIEVVEACGGIIAIAAQRFGVHRNTLWNWIKASPELQARHEAIEEQTLDLAEANLIKALREGEWDATKFYLTTKGKRRGYGFRAELSGQDGGPIRIAQEPAIDFTKLTDAEMKVWWELQEKAATTERAGGQ